MKRRCSQIDDDDCDIDNDDDDDDECYASFPLTICIQIECWPPVSGRPLHCTALHFTISVCWVVLPCVALHCFVLHCIAMACIQYSVLHTSLQLNPTYALHSYRYHWNALQCCIALVSGQPYLSWAPTFLFSPIAAYGQLLVDYCCILTISRTTKDIDTWR